VIVALGSIAYKTLTGQVETNKKGEQKIKLGTRTVKAWRGFYEEITLSWTSKKGKTKKHTVWLVPTFHPAACLHNWELDDLLVFDLSIAKDLVAGKQPLKKPTTKVRVVKDFAGAKSLIALLKQQQRFAFDLETTGLSPHSAKIMCFGFCFEKGEAWILPWHTRGPTERWTPKEQRILVRLLTDLFETSSLVGQNIKFDLKHIRKLTGITDFNISFDTMIAQANIDENKSKGLTFLCQWYLRWTKYDAAMDKWKGKGGKRGFFKTWEVPDHMLWEYCGYDCDGNWSVREKQIPLLKKEKTVGPYKNHMGLIHPLMDAEYRGIQGDKDRLLYMSKQFRAESKKIVKKLRKKADKHLGEVRDKKGVIIIFNPNSPVQLANLLKAVGATLTRKTPAGNASTNKFVLEALSLQKTKAGTIARDIRKLRKLEGYITKNLDGTDGDEGFIQHMEDGDRFHPNYNIHIARTGRQSADDPPVQTLPRTGAIRTILVPDTPDHVILSADYEKVELCVLSWLANEEIMINELASDVDLHTRMAVVARLMREPTDEEWERIAPLIGKDERSVAKGANFGIPYGRGAYAIAEAPKGSKSH
jgi:DNA polymerase-1